MSEEPVVIVGAGAAAQAAAGAYREAGGRAPVTIFGAEPLLPYERPPLSKDYLRGEVARSDLLIESAQWYRERQIEVVRGTRIEQINLERMSAYTDDGISHPFGQCLLATGARPQSPGVLGGDLRFVRSIREATDSERLARAAGRRVLVVGSGFIGCEAAASLAMRKADVTIATLEAGPQLGRLGEQVSQRVAGWLEELDIDLLAEAELAQISERDDPDGIVEFKDGRRVEAEVVLLALGISRNDELAGDAGIEVEDGIPTDSSMRTSHPSLFAAGDVAFAENDAASRPLRVEHWGEALNQGEIAGKTMAGVEARWDVAPGFWSTVGEKTVKYAGWGDGWDEVRFEEGGGEDFVAWYGNDGELAGVLAHRREDAYESGKEKIERRDSWS